MGLNSQSKDPSPAGVLNRTLVVIMLILTLVSKGSGLAKRNAKIIMECYLLSEHKVTGYRKHILSL